jgi:hypothetical protein
MIAALFVETNGCYFNLPDVDPWDKKRDARVYSGPYPVIAHPPCERWGRYWGGAPSQWPRLKIGDDNGCFKAALEAVRKYGGILEHPEGSHAWRYFHLNNPPRWGGWVNADWEDGWTCCIEQGSYGHLARKASWLYAKGIDFKIPLIWGRSKLDFLKLDEGYHSTEERKRKIKTGICQRLSHKQRSATPLLFRDLLFEMARSVKCSSFL